MGIFNFSKKSNVQSDSACAMTWNELAKQLMTWYRDVEVLDRECLVIPVSGFHCYVRHHPKKAFLSVETAWRLNPEDISSFQDLAVFCNDSNRAFLSKVFVLQYEYEGEKVMDLCIVKEIPFFDSITAVAINQKLLELVADNGDIMAEFNRRFPSQQDSAKKAEALQTEKNI